MAAAINLKAFDTLRAQAALQGFMAGCTAEGWIILRRLGVSAVFDTVSDAARWLDAREGGIAK